MYFNQLWLNPA